MMTVSIFRETDTQIIEKHPLFPNNGQKASENGGTVSICYNDEGFIFTFECPYTMPLKLPYSAYNDPVWRGEAVEVFISPYGDRTHYFEFDTAPNNSCYNAQVLNIGEPDVYVRTINNCPVVYNSTVYESFYTTQIRIPFSILTRDNISPYDIPWLFNSYRISHGDGVKMFALSPTRCASFHVPSNFSGLKLV